MRTHAIEIEGVKLGIREGSAKGQPVVFVHGNSLSGDLFDEQLEDPALAAWRLVAVDCPGHGVSDDAPAHYGFWRLVELLVRAVTELGIVQPVLVGHSIGGHLCFQMASRLSSVRGVFVQGTPPFDGPDAIGRAFLPNPCASSLFAEDMTENAARSLSQAMLSVGHPALRRVHDALTRTDGRARAKLAEDIVQGVPNELALIASLPCPVAVVHGENDALVSRAYLDALSSECFWGERVHVLQDANHCAHLDRPEAYNRLLESFLRDVTSC
jgi:pimeloyl-ACP methyl ester carboxylesterase